MPAVLICTKRELLSELGGTLLGRGGIDRFKAARLEEARLLARTTRPALVLLDRDLPNVRDFLDMLRAEPATRTRSIAILAQGDIEPSELELLELGANAILRLPADSSWDERFSRLLSVPLRQEARLTVPLAVETRTGLVNCSTQALNLSVSGMLVEAQSPLGLFEELSFDFTLPDGSRVAGRGRVVRQAAAKQYGIEFVRLDDSSKEAVRQYVRSASVGQQ